MFLHIGDSRIVFDRDLIGIFNNQKVDKNSNGPLFESALVGHLQEPPIQDRVKSFIVTDKQVYTSPISPITLTKRQQVICKSGRAKTTV